MQGTQLFLSSLASVTLWMVEVNQKYRIVWNGRSLNVWCFGKDREYANGKDYQKISQLHLYYITRFRLLTLKD
jgi:hypothetical protein